MDVCQNEAEKLEENNNTNYGRKHTRRHRNRSEKQEQRVRKYKKKKREEKVKIELEKLTENVQTESPDITKAPVYLTGAEAWSYKNISSEPRMWYQGNAVLPGVYEGIYWSYIGMRCLENVSVTVGGMVPVAREWCAGNVYTNTTDIHVRNAQNWQQKELSNLKIQADAFVPLSNTISLETTVPTVGTQYEIVSTLRASADVFVPGILKPTSLPQQAEIVSNLQAAAEPFIPKVEQEPSVSSYAETIVPTKSTSCTKSEEPDATARFCEDIFELNAAKSLKAHTFTTSADSNMPSEKVSVDSVAPAISNVLSKKVLVDITAPVDSNVPSQKAITDAAAHLNSNVPFQKAPVIHEDPADSTMQFQKVPTGITAPVDSNVQSEKTATDTAAPMDSSITSEEAPSNTIDPVDSNMPSKKAHVDIVSSEKSPVESVAHVNSNVPYEKTPADIAAPVDSNVSSAKTPVDIESRVDSKVPSEKTCAYTIAPVDSNVLSGNTNRESASTSISALRSPAAIFVPAEESSSAVPAPSNVQRDGVTMSQIILDNPSDDVDNMLGILAIYAESGLHCEADEILRNRKEITEEDFGYTYFSLSNLLK